MNVVDQITVLSSCGRRLTKLWNADGPLIGYDNAKTYTAKIHQVGSLVQFAIFADKLATRTNSCIIRGTPRTSDDAFQRWQDEPPKTGERFPKKGFVYRRNSFFADQPLHLLMLDIDKWPTDLDAANDPIPAVLKCISAVLPEFRGASFYWQLSSSAGHPSKVGTLSAHLWYWLAEPKTSAEVKTLFAGREFIDDSLFQEVQIHYTANPVFAPGVADPINRRSGLFEGSFEDVDVSQLREAPSSSKRIVNTDADSEKANTLADDMVAVAELRAVLADFDGSPLTYPEYFRVGMAINKVTKGSAEGEALWDDFAKRSSKFEEEEHANKWPSFHHQREGGVGLGTVIYLKNKYRSKALKPKGTVIEAVHLCTDLANAKRISAKFGNELMVVLGRCYRWTGTHWAWDEGEVYRLASTISVLVKDEAQVWAAKPAATADEEKLNGDMADALVKWSKKCESKQAIDAAFGLLKKLLNVAIDQLDADPWALNCLNGTVDLRTGAIRPHDPTDRITLCLDIAYEPEAGATRFTKFLEEITASDAQISKFLQRWWGYSATGSIREQVFLVFTGKGANGKGTLVNACDAVLGPYAIPAPPNLLVGSRAEDRHPTELADLQGRRLVTASETEDTSVLREAFLKKVTGGDKLKARVMRGDFYEFKPTFKIQLLTNHLPRVKGTDYAIWRRTLIVNFPVIFGTADDVRENRAHRLRDNTLDTALLAEREGILAWIVAGAIEWFSGGLRPPESVLRAVRKYQTEQDQIVEFVAEKCDIGTSEYVGAKALHEDYMKWSRASGFAPQTRGRFLEELQRVVPTVFQEERTTGPKAKRKTAIIIRGIGLAAEFAEIS